MKKRTVFLILGIILLLGAAAFGVRLFMVNYAPAAASEDYAPDAETVAQSAERAGTAAANDTDVNNTAADDTAENDAEDAEPYVSPIDFDSLQAINPDIYAWIVIPGTNISYPVAQSPDDEDYYLNHDTDGSYSANGSIFSQSEYNAKDFTTDPVVVLYGHHMSSGDMFGKLQQYYNDEEFFAEDNPIIIYTPEAEYVYRVFAAVPYSNEHILYYFDFSQPAVYSEFFEAILGTRSLSAVFNDEYTPQYGDKVLILSTCLIGNNTQRFLVMGTLQDGE